jgi:hypothetical protein
MNDAIVQQNAKKLFHFPWDVFPRNRKNERVFLHFVALVQFVLSALRILRILPCVGFSFGLTFWLLEECSSSVVTLNYELFMLWEFHGTSPILIIVDLNWINMSQHPLVHHPFATYYDSIEDESQLKYQGLNLVTYLINYTILHPSNTNTTTTYCKWFSSHFYFFPMD